MDTFEFRDGELCFTGNTMVPDVPRPGGRYKVAFFSVSERKEFENTVLVKFDLPCDGVRYEDSLETLKKIAPNFYIISAAIIKPWHEQVMTITGITNSTTAMRIQKKKGEINVRL